MSGETSPRFLKRKDRFEDLWGEYINERVEQRWQKVSVMPLFYQRSWSFSSFEYKRSLRGPLNSHLVLDAQAEYTEGEELPSEHAIALTQCGKSPPEVKKEYRAALIKMIKKQIAFRERHEKQMESLDPSFSNDGKVLRSGRKIRVFGWT
ncbi:MAG: hypothetical protein Q9172_003422 [Xanthocarpia lactea]